MKQFDIFYDDECGNHQYKTVKTKRTADKYIKEFCMKYGKCNLVVWVDGEITDTDTFARKLW